MPGNVARVVATAASSGTTATSIPITLTQAIRAGNHCTVCIAAGLASGQNPTIADANSNTYSNDSSSTQGTARSIHIFSAYSAAQINAGTTLTVTLPAASGYAIAILEGQDIATASWRRSNGFNNSSNSNNATVTNLGAALAGDLILGAVNASAAEILLPTSGCKNIANVVGTDGSGNTYQLLVSARTPYQPGTFNTNGYLTGSRAFAAGGEVMAMRSGVTAAITADRNTVVATTKLILGRTLTQHWLETFGDATALLQGAAREAEFNAVGRGLPWLVEPMMGFGQTTNISPTSGGAYDWSGLDTRINRMRANGGTVTNMAIEILGTPRWMQDIAADTAFDTNIAPTSGHYTDYATMVTAAVNRYTDVNIWIVWNEPDSKGFTGSTYLAFYNVIAAAIRAARPGAMIVAGYFTLGATSSNLLTNRAAMTTLKNGYTTTPDYLVIDGWVAAPTGGGAMTGYNKDGFMAGVNAMIDQDTFLASLQTGGMKRGWMEYYPRYDLSSITEDQKFYGAWHAYFLLRLAQNGADVAIKWQPEAENTLGTDLFGAQYPNGIPAWSNDGLYTTTRTGTYATTLGGKWVPAGISHLNVMTLCPPGTVLYQVTSNIPDWVACFASDTWTWYINLTEMTQVILVEGATLTLMPYEQRVLTRNNTTLIYDSFTDTNGTLIAQSGQNTSLGHITETGHVWQLMGGAPCPTIQNGALVAGSTSSINLKIKVQTRDPVITSKQNLGIDGVGTRNINVLFRYQDQNNYWALRATRTTNGSTARLELWNRNAGSASSVLASGGSIAANTDFTVKLIASGAVIMAYLDGTLVFTYIDTSGFLARERVVGLRFDGGTDPTGRAVLDYKLEGPVPPSPIFWTCNFEGEGSIAAGTLTQWTLDGDGAFAASGTGGTQTNAVSTAQAHSGVYSLKIGVTGIGAVGSGEQGMRAFFNDPPRTHYQRFYLYIPQLVTVGSGFWNIWQIKSVPYVSGTPFSSSQVSWGMYLANRAGSGNMYLILRDKTGDYTTLNVNDETPTITYQQTAADLPVGQWVCIEVYIKGRNDTTGEITVWQDGTQLWSFTGRKTVNSYDQFQSSINTYLGGVSPTAVDLYIDDVVISSIRVGL